MEQNPIDKMRSRGGKVDIGEAEEGAIIEMINTGNHLLTIKERAVYELSMADQIDPERENPNISPTSQRLVVTLGTESEMFSRTFMTAKQLFAKNQLPNSFDSEKMLFVTLDLVKELSALETEITAYLELEKKAVEKYEERKTQKLDHLVPSIPDIKTRGKTIFQKADHALMTQLKIIRFFYPDFDEGGYYGQFTKWIKEKYGDEDPFPKFLETVLPFILSIRNIRNCLEHQDRTETEIKDFEHQKSGDILTPTIEVHYRGTNIERVAFSEYLNVISDNLIHIFENLCAYLCSKAEKPSNALPREVREVPEEKRRHKFVKFAYWSPFGEGGYYHQ